MFERLDFRPLRISPLLPIAATKPLGEAIRLDAVRARVAADLRERLPLADDDRELGEALDRWELSLFADEPFRSSQVRDALTSLLGAGDGSWAAGMRCAVLLEEKSADRIALATQLQAEDVGPAARDALRRALVETLLHGNRAALVETLDETLLGPRPRPASVLAGLASAARYETGTDTSRISRYFRGMDEAEAVLERLERIRELDRADAPAAVAAGRAPAARDRGGGVGARRGRCACPRGGRLARCGRGPAGGGDAEDAEECDHADS